MEIPICSMDGIFTYIWLKCMVTVGTYPIHEIWDKDSYEPTSIMECHKMSSGVVHVALEFSGLGSRK